MRIEGEDDGGTAEPLRLIARAGNERLMPAMDAVEVADRDGRGTEVERLPRLEAMESQGGAPYGASGGSVRSMMDVSRPPLSAALSR